MEREWSGNAKRLSQADRSEIERLIWSGETFATAAAAVGCSTKSIQRFLALTGGLKRRIKVRSALRLSLGEREELSRGLLAGDSLRTIATRLGRAPSTISREVAWNGPRRAAPVAAAVVPSAFTNNRRVGIAEPPRVMLHLSSWRHLIWRANPGQRAERKGGPSSRGPW